MTGIATAATVDAARMITVQHSTPSQGCETVTFDRDVTKAEFEAWLSANDYAGYPPAGYGHGHASVHKNIGEYRHAKSCD